MKNVKNLKQNLSDVLYSLQHLKVDGVDLSAKLKIEGFVALSSDKERTDASDLNVAYNLSQALKAMTEGIKTPKNSGVTGAINMAEQNKKK